MTNGEFDIPLGGNIVSIEPKRIRVRGDDESDFYISHQQVLKNMHVTSIKGVEDMIALGDLQEYAILRNLHIRYRAKQIYVSMYYKCTKYTNMCYKKHYSKSSTDT